MLIRSRFMHTGLTWCYLRLEEVVEDVGGSMGGVGTCIGMETFNNDVEGPSYLAGVANPE